MNTMLVQPVPVVRTTRRGFSAWLAAIAAAALAAGTAQAVQNPATGLAAAGSETAVILLTGFEPFGQPRMPNSSWEGIKELDGREWNGFRLVARQMHVVWGAPLRELEAWSSEFKPVAIFSFGQGMPDAFAIETRASNQRGPIEDNNGARPAKPLIVADGPDEFHATADSTQLARSLTAKGYPIRVSTRAGRYLCEEALYSLEFLKSTQTPDTRVLFCHVPPLAARLRNTPVTAEYVQRFVEDLLESWHATTHAAAGEPAQAGTASNDPRHGEVREFIDRYFRTWSNQDMDGYGDCFLPKATIQFIDADGEIYGYARNQFLANQRDYHRKSPHRSVEVAESVEIRFEAKLARAVVFWRLNAGPRIETGYDHFTLVKQSGKWRILNLVFYKSDP